jgi:hypothetical protein
MTALASPHELSIAVILHTAQLILSPIQSSLLNSLCWNTAQLRNNNDINVCFKQIIVNATRKRSY